MTILERLERRIELMSTVEVCQYLGCHENTLYDRVRKKRLRAIKDGGRWRFDPAEILRYIRERTI